MKKLFVAGCSFSDYTQIDKVYGEFIAEKLGYEYVHEGAGCGSNWRTWRVITKHIMSGNLTPGDLLIIQYTQKTRNEFWTKVDYAPSVDLNKKQNLPEKYTDDGYVIRYKSGASRWQLREAKQFFELYENAFLSPTFENERFITSNFMFQHMLVRNNVKVIFIQSPRYPINSDDILPEYLKYTFSEPVSYDALMRYNLLPDDFGHMSQEGHEVFAEWLVNHINKSDLRG